MKNIFRLLISAGIVLVACNEKPQLENIEKNTSKLNTKDSIASFYHDSVPVITEFSGENDCHGCSGGLLIKRGSHTDTIFGGTWGNPPFWFEQKTENKHDLVIISEFFSGGITESSLRVWSLDKSTFLQVKVDTLFIDGMVDNLTYLRYDLNVDSVNQITLRTYHETYHEVDEGSDIREIDEEVIVF